MTIEKELFQLLQEHVVDVMTALHYCAKGQGDEPFPGENHSFREQLRCNLDAVGGLSILLSTEGLIPTHSQENSAAVFRAAMQFSAKLKEKGVPLK